jgi:hypothetical protein
MSLVVRAGFPLEDDPAPPPWRVDLLTFDRTFGNMSEIVEPLADGGNFGDDAGRGEGMRDEAEDPCGDGARVGAVDFREDI